ERENGNTDDQSTTLPTGGLRVTGELTGYPYQVVWDATTSNDYTVPSLAAAVRNRNTFFVSAGSQLIYYVEFTGNTTTVPVRVQAGGEATAAKLAEDTGFYRYGDNAADAVVSMTSQTYPFDRVFFASAYSDPVGNPGTQLISLDQTFTLQTDTIYQVFMSASAQAYANY